MSDYLVTSRLRFRPILTTVPEIRNLEAASRVAFTRPRRLGKGFTHGSERTDRSGWVRDVLKEITQPRSRCSTSRLAIKGRARGSSAKGQLPPWKRFA